MFDSLTQKLNQTFDRLRGRGALTEEEVGAALREVRLALLEADVALPVVKEFVDRVKAEAVGEKLIKNVQPGQVVIKLVHDQLVDVLGREAEPLCLSSQPPATIMMVGLQGSGKTTTSAKVARYLYHQQKKKVLLVSVDVYRPAAQHQLEVLAQQIKIDALPIKEGEKPVAIAKRAMETARLENYDVMIVDTAGRLHVDDVLMEELTQLHDILSPTEILFVADAMMGQDAVVTAKAFKERIEVTGIVLTRIDGDARGGAALSMRAVTDCPIKLMGVGEKLEALEVFHPDRIASRILGMGDIVSLVEKAAQVIDEEESAKLEARLRKGIFTLGDMAEQMSKVHKMGGLESLLNMIPGLGKLKDKLGGNGIEDKTIKRQIAIIQSMTPQERRHYKLIGASRKRRIAEGSGQTVQEVNRLLKQYQGMLKMMKRMKNLTPKDLLRGGFHDIFPR